MMSHFVRRREVWWAAVSAHHFQSKGLAGNGVPRRSTGARRNAPCGFPRGSHHVVSNSATHLLPEPPGPPPTASTPSIRSSNRGSTGHHPANFGPTALSPNCGSLLHVCSCFLCARLWNVDSGYQSQPVLNWDPALESTVLSNPAGKPSFSFSHSHIVLLSFFVAVQYVYEDAAAKDFG